MVACVDGGDMDECDYEGDGGAGDVVDDGVDDGGADYDVEMMMF